MKYKSAGVMEQEKTLIDDEIIYFKKTNNLEYDFFETKKNIIDMEISKIQTNILCGNLSFTDYKKNLTKQLSYEEKLLENSEKDTDLNIEEKNKVRERIINRINILNEELKQEVDEEEKSGDEEENNKNEKIMIDKDKEDNNEKGKIFFY